MRGQNPIRPQELGDGQSLWVQSVFYTLQGEGPFSGQPAVFVRLAGCNLKCYWCDTDFESSEWSPSLPELLARIDQTLTPACNLIVITGGEPFRQNIAPLIMALRQRQLRVQIETNGTIWVDIPNDPEIYIVCSPKTNFIHERLRERITAYKYVVSANDLESQDGLPILSTQRMGISAEIARPQTGRPIYVLPMDSHDKEQNSKNQDAAVEIALRHGYTLTLQTHKLLQIE